MPSPPKYYSVSLPCKPYIKKYVQSLYGNPVPANNKSTLGCYVNACLVKQRYTEHNYTDSFIHKNFTDKLCFHVSGWTFINIGFDFPTAKVIEINKFLENSFEEHMYQWCHVRYEKGKTEYRRLIEDFAEGHGIILEEDISLDALVKTEYRMRVAIERNRQKAQKNMPELFR